MPVFWQTEVAMDICSSAVAATRPCSASDWWKIRRNAWACTRWADESVFEVSSGLWAATSEDRNESSVWHWNIKWRYAVIVENWRCVLSTRYSNQSYKNGFSSKTTTKNSSKWFAKLAGSLRVTTYQEIQNLVLWKSENNKSNFYSHNSTWLWIKKNRYWTTQTRGKTACLEQIRLNRRFVSQFSAGSVNFQYWFPSFCCEECHNECL